MSNRRRPSFAFIVHPRSVPDLDRYGAARFLKRYSKSEAEYVRKAMSIRVLTLGELVFGVNPFFGELIGVLRMPEDWVGTGAAQAVQDGVALAASRGARVVGLGGLTAPATGSGHRLLRNLPQGVTLTNGNAYTAHVVYENVLDALRILGVARPLATIGIVGCTGSVGTPATQLISEAGLGLVLVGRHHGRLEQKFAGLPRALFTTEMSELKRADIVVLLTSDPSAMLLPHHLRPGTIVIDCAQPANISPDRAAGFHAAGTLVCEGGIVQIPGFSSTADLGLGGPNEAFACLAETYLYARNGLRSHSTGAPPIELCRRLARLANAEGIAMRPLRDASRPNGETARTTEYVSI